MKVIIADVDYVIGHFKYGHFELEVNDEEYEEFQTYSDEEKKEYIGENGDLIIDDYVVDNLGNITNIRVYND